MDEFFLCGFEYRFFLLFEVPMFLLFFFNFCIWFCLIFVQFDKKHTNTQTHKRTKHTNTHKHTQNTQTHKHTQTHTKKHTSITLIPTNPRKWRPIIFFPLPSPLLSPLSPPPLLSLPLLRFHNIFRVVLGLLCHLSRNNQGNLVFKKKKKKLKLKKGNKNNYEVRNRKI